MHSPPADWGLSSMRLWVGAVLVANEVVDQHLKLKVGGLVCKLDLEKAYDNVCLGFFIHK